MRTKVALAVLILLILCRPAAYGQDELPQPAVAVVAFQGLAMQWDFTPVYALAGNARNIPGRKETVAGPPAALLEKPASPLPRLLGKDPTEARTDLLKAEALPQKSLSLEVWVLDHVDQPVGALAGAVSGERVMENGWFLAFYDRRIYFGLKGSGNPSGALTVISELKPKPWKKWFYHVVGVYDGAVMKLYVNGDLAVTSNAQSGEIAYGTETQFDVIGYFQNEPYMQLGNLVREVWLYDRPLSAGEIKSRMDDYRIRAEEGIGLTVAPHFTMGPILQNVTRDGIALAWETDRPMTGTVKYGASAALGKELAAPESSRMHKVTLKGLDPGSPYFYSVTAKTESGPELESGTLTFKTAVAPEGAFTFALLGDPETRPQINDRLAKLIWAERPDFTVILGDLTDEGYQDNKFQWNYEFFAGFTQLLSRVPLVPVPGNGEKDMEWFKYFFAAPEQKNYYKFSYGNADFFILNSNLPYIPATPLSPQYQWLEKELAASTARWKFVCLHYAPYSSDENDYGDTYKGRSDWGDSLVRGYVPLYEKYGVDMVFYGHLHDYERTWPIRAGKAVEKNGVIYVMSGGGGGNLEDFAPNRPWFSNVLYRGHHFCLASINGGTLQFRMYDLDGKLQDSFSINK